MAAEIVFSTTADYAAATNVLQEPVQHDVESEVAPVTPVCSAQELYITNVGDTRAINCGFYISPVGIDSSPRGLSEFTEIMSWSADGSEYGVYTVQGDDEIANYLNPSGADYLCEYNNVAEQHTYTNGSTILNRILLKDMDGTYGKTLLPITSAGASQARLFVMVKIPNAEAAGVYRFTHHFYYEEPI